MGRPKKAAPKYIEPEDDSQDMEEPEPPEPDEDIEPGTAAANGKPMSKAKACRAALAAGVETTEDAIDFARSRFGIDIKPTDFTLYKSKAKMQAGATSKARSGRKPKAAPGHAVEGYLAPPPRPAPVGGQPDLIESLETLKPLIASLGADRVKRLVDLLG